MSFLEDKCTLFPLTSSQEIEGFSCGDLDLDEFFTRDCFAYAKELLGKTYCYKLDEDPQKVVCAFTLANQNGFQFGATGKGLPPFRLGNCFMYASDVF